MRDEPEMRNCFQCEVSLNMSQAKKGILLVNAYSHEEFGTAELGRDAGIRPGQPEVNLVPRRSSSHLWFYRGSAEGPAVPALEPRSTRRGASVPDEGQRIEPGPDHAAHRRLDADAAGAETTTPTAQFSPAVLQRPCALAGRGGRRSRGSAQITRLIAAWMQTRQVRRRPPQRPNFPRRYSSADVLLLAEVDAAHEELSGPATRHILEREFSVFGKAEYEELSGISVSHIYNLRRSKTYLRYRVRVQHTQRSRVSIAERRKPDPQGKPGYLRVDTVHQGQHDGQPGLYHLNAVDTVTQWEIVGCVETISERHLLPVLEAMLHQFPFRILGFHCDNGSEFINHQVAALLNQLLVEFTKSRAYRTTDNALVEGKNGAVVRKHIGYGPIGAPHAEELQKFFTAHFNPYLNYHRPCS